MQETKVRSDIVMYKMGGDLRTGEEWLEVGDSIDNIKRRLKRGVDKKIEEFFENYPNPHIIVRHASIDNENHSVIEGLGKCDKCGKIYLVSYRCC